MSDVPLDMSQFERVVFEGFEDNRLHPSFDIRWGPDGSLRFENGWAVFESTRAGGWQDSGLIQGPFGADSGQGYGLYEMVVQLEPNQGGGVAGLLWPGTNRWPGPETDLIESPDVERVQGFWVIHWEGPNGENHFDYFINEKDWTEPTRIQLLWEPGKMTYLLDGEVKQVVTENVPVAFEDGGQNLVIGLQVTAADTYFQPSDAVRFRVDEVAFYEQREGAPPAVPPETPVAAPAVFDWDTIARLTLERFNATGVWSDPLNDPSWFENEAPVPPDATIQPASPPTPGEDVDWDLIAFRTTEWFNQTGSWNAPSWFLFGEGAPDPATPPASPEPAPPAVVDWNAIAAEVTARFEATGVWS